MNEPNRPQAADFFITGGTLRADAPSYIARQADEDLYAALSSGEYCYVLTSRQMGKSSLMVRTATRLAQDGVSVGVVDLTAIGQNVTVEQWYEGLLLEIGDKLDIEDALEEFWEESLSLGPLQRWTRAVSEVVLPAITGRVVLFIDEIDVVQSLPFSTNEFFAAIREFYTRRATDPDYERLSFCLLGVATPSDLIDDARVTPFNIGHRVELSDFTDDEAQQLTAGLGRQEDVAAALMPRVQHWTGGHPYLTQRLSQAVAEDGSVTHSNGVDRICAELFFSERAQEQDSNLQFVRNQMLGREDVDAAALLTLYRDVRAGKSVPHDETNPLVNVLQLSGIASAVGGRMRVRNRIYEHVFHADWVAENMPDAELRRQRAAYRRGMLRTAGIAAAVLTVMTVLAVFAFDKAREAGKEALQHRVALSRAQAERGVRQLQEGNLVGLHDLVLARESAEGTPEQEGRELLWSGWYATAAGRLQALISHDGIVNDIAYSPDGSRLFTASDDGTARFWDGHNGVPRTPPLDAGGTPFAVAYSPTGEYVAAAGPNAQMWDARTGEPHGPTLMHTGVVYDVAFSPDGKVLATGSQDGGARLWNVDTGELRGPAIMHGGEVHAVTFSPDASLLATAADDGVAHVVRVADAFRVATLIHDSRTRTVTFSPDGSIIATASGSIAWLWDVYTGALSAPKLTHAGRVNDVAFSPDGRLLATGASDGTGRLWDAVSGAALGVPLEHAASVLHISFSPDGSDIAVATDDNIVRVYDVASRDLSTPPIRLVGSVTSVEFNPDGNSLAVATTDGVVTTWNLRSVDLTAEIVADVEASYAAALSPQGKYVAAVSGDRYSVYVVDTVTGRLPYAPRHHTARVFGVAFSPDGSKLATTAFDARTRLWDVATGTEIPTDIRMNGWTTAVCFHPDGLQIAIGRSPAVRGADYDDWHPVASVLDLRDPYTVNEKPLHSQNLLGMMFSPDGDLLATSSWDNTARIWEVGSHAVAVTLQHQDTVRDVVFRDYLNRWCRA